MTTSSDNNNDQSVHSNGVSQTTNVNENDRAIQRRKCAINLGQGGSLFYHRPIAFQSVLKRPCIFYNINPINADGDSLIG